MGDRHLIRDFVEIPGSRMQACWKIQGPAFRFVVVARIFNVASD